MKQMTVGIAGTAKNTGKTTTTRVLLEHFQDRQVSLGITSIGYDGERIDNITGLPKPRIFLKKGDFVAVSEKCLPVSSARVKVMEIMDINTPLGRIVCGQVMKDGLLVVAGPNQSRHLGMIKDWMYSQGTGLVIVDGALNRIAPMVETDGFILSTGAAYTVDINRLAAETRSIEVVCNLPEKMEAPADCTAAGKSVLWSDGGYVLAEWPSFLFDPDPLNNLAGMMGNAAGFYCPGVVSGQCLDHLGGLDYTPGTVFVFEDPVKLILGDVTAARRFMEGVLSKGGKIGYRRPLPLLAVTVNPFYPSYRYGSHDYQADFVDRNLLLTRIRSAVDVPVCDVVFEGPGTLASVMDDFTQK